MSTPPADDDLASIKVFGERNCGTTWVEQLLKFNFRKRDVLHHHGTLRDVRKAPIPRTGRGREARIARRRERERRFDAHFSGPDAPAFGWKHAAIDVDRLAQSDLFASTVFVCVIRNPFQFLLSLHRRPYHAMIEVPRDFGAFVRSPWPTTARDGVPHPVLEKGATELWNHKTRSYLEARRRHPAMVVVRYEDCVADVGHLFREIEARTGLAPRRAVRNVERSTKGDDKSFEEYQRQTAAFDPRQAMDADTYDYVAAVLDRELATTLGYLDAPAAAAAPAPIAPAARTA